MSGSPLRQHNAGTGRSAPRRPRVGFSLKLRRGHCGKHNRIPNGAAADKVPSTADQKGQHPSARPRRTERAERGGLLLAVVLIRDQRDQRGDQRRARDTCQKLGGQHMGGGRAEGHQHLGPAEQRHDGAETYTAPNRWVNFAPSMTKAATQASTSRSRWRPWSAAR